MLFYEFTLKTINITDAKAPLIRAYGSCVLTCSTTSQSAAIEEMIVVSEIGEQWSPKIPPLKTAPIAKMTFASIPTAIGTAIGIIIEKVPQDVPVEKDISELSKKIITARKIGLTLCEANEAK